MRYREWERELGPLLTRFAVEEYGARFRAADLLHWPERVSEAAETNKLVQDLAPQFGHWLAHTPALEDVTRVTQAVAQRLHERKAFPTRYRLSEQCLLSLRERGLPEEVRSQLNGLKERVFSSELAFVKALGRRVSSEQLGRHKAEILEQAAYQMAPSSALELREFLPARVISATAEALGAEHKTFAGEVLKALEKRRTDLWVQHIHKEINWELFDRGVEAYTWAALEEVGRSAKGHKLLSGVKHGEECGRFIEETARARNGKKHDPNVLQPFVALRQELEKPFGRGLILWQRKGGPKGDLLQEMDQVVQMPGWSNIWTQPIQNRVDMLSTGVRTQIGVKVFGPDLDTINDVCKQIEQALKPIPGAMDVLAEPFMGKGYLEIKIDRQKAARYGLRVGDIQDTIEVALGGKLITQTVEGRDRFPVRIRYGRAFREDEQAVRRLLVVRGTMGAGTAAPGTGMASAEPGHQAGPSHAVDGKFPLQVPLSEVAEVRVVEGPAVIKSENGRLRSFVTLNVRGDRDVVGFVEEAQRVLAQTVKLPEGTHIEWSGEFEHQARAARTLRIILPVVLVLIFTILYLTYKDLSDAGLMLLAVPEALAGGVFFQFLFPKLVHGWSSPPEPFTLAVWVGYIAAFGMATETGIIMLVYLREAIDKRGGLAKIGSLEELRQAVIEGAVQRLRPKLLTEGVAIVAIAPMLFSAGVGSEIISAMALPVLGGLLIADEVVDIFLPVRFYWVRRARWLKMRGKAEARTEPKLSEATLALASRENQPSLEESFPSMTAS